MSRKNRRRGSAVVLLCILFVTLTGALAVTYEAADRKAAIGVSEAAFDSAGRSMLACYDKELFDRYSLFAFEGDEEKTEKRVKKIAAASIENTSVAGCRIRELDAEQSAYSMADPENMMLQLREVVKKSAAKTVISGVKENLNAAGSRVKDKDNTKKKITVLERERDTAAEAEAAADASAGTGIVPADGAPAVSEMSAEEARKIQDGLKENAKAVKDEPSGTSEEGRTLKNGRVTESLPSASAGCRSRSAYAGGTVLKDLGGGTGGAEDDLTTVAYIDGYFSCHQDPAEADRFFRNEVEYILYGCMSDRDNYKKAYRSIFVIRTAVNTAYLYSSPQKSSAILAAAEALTPGPFAPLTQLLIITAWAAVEAQNDMKNLEAGNGVPLMKSESTWMTDINSAVSGVSGENYIPIPGNSVMKYGRYLDMLLLTLDRDTKLYRIMDLIQINLKGTARADFTIADHYTGFALRAVIDKKSHAVGVVDSSADISMTHTYLTGG